MGAPQANGGAGEVLVYRGAALPSTAPAWVLHGAAADDNFGAALAGAASTRGGGFAPDLVVGAPFDSQANVWAGRAYLYFGGTPPDTVPDRLWSGAAAGDFLGTSVSGAGDVNGDGRADVLVGAPGANNGPMLDAGRAYLYLGAAVPPAVPALTVTGAAANDELGLAVAGIGDVNADGRSDFAVGAPAGADSTKVGEVRAFLSRAIA